MISPAYWLSELWDFMKRPSGQGGGRGGEWKREGEFYIEEDSKHDSKDRVDRVRQIRGSISYRVGGSACPFVSEPNAPAVHADLPYPQA